MDRVARSLASAEMLRISRPKVTSPGMTFITPGVASITPTVATTGIGSLFCAICSAANMISAAAQSPS